MAGPVQQVSRPCLSVVMPAYNEEGAIEAAVAEVREHVLDRVPGAELVVVNDGSRDRTGALLDALAAADPRVRPLHQANGGHGAALRAGLDAARGDYLFLLDSDRQIPLDRFLDAWELAHAGHDGVFGVRRRRHDPRLRLVLTRVIHAVLRLLLGVTVRDANVPYKLVRREAWQAARADIPPGTLAPSLFLAAWMQRHGRPIAELDVTHRERSTGVVSIRRWKLLKFCARGFRQLWDFRRRLPAAA